MVTKIIDVTHVDSQFAELLALLAEGTEVILTDGVKPLARLVPFKERTGERVAGLHSGSIHMAEGFEEPLPDEFWMGEG